MPGQVRIIGGRLRGSVLSVPVSAGLRPTPSRMRETLFNWLQPVTPGAHCLDLFAGSGALGIEALSRGAADCRFVERDAGLAQALRDNLERLGQHHAEVDCADALAFLRMTPPRAFDLVFVDPPFAAALWDTVTAALGQSAWLAPGAWMYLEAPLTRPLEPPPDWDPYREGRAGEVRGMLYRRA